MQYGSLCLNDVRGAKTHRKKDQKEFQDMAENNVTCNVVMY